MMEHLPPRWEGYYYPTKRVVDPEVHRDPIKNLLNTFIKSMCWNQNRYIIRIYCKVSEVSKVSNDGGSFQFYPIDNFLATDEPALVEFLVTKYLERGRAIWMSNLHLRDDTDTPDDLEIKKQIYGSHILDYSKTEKKFVGNPSRCIIVFRPFCDQSYYDLDDLLKKIAQINIENELNLIDSSSSSDSNIEVIRNFLVDNQLIGQIIPEETK